MTTPQLDDAVLRRIVMAGQKLMYNAKTRKYLINGLKKSGAPADILSAEVVGLMKLLDDKAGAGKGRGLPKQVIAPVAVALLVEAAHFAAEAGIFTVTEEDMAAAVKKTVLTLMKMYGVLDELLKAQANAKQAPPPQPAGGMPAQGGLLQQGGV